MTTQPSFLTLPWARISLKSEFVVRQDREDHVAKDTTDVGKETLKDLFTTQRAREPAQLELCLLWRR